MNGERRSIFRYGRIHVVGPARDAAHHVFDVGETIREEFVLHLGASPAQFTMDDNIGIGIELADMGGETWFRRWSRRFRESFPPTPLKPPSGVPSRQGELRSPLGRLEGEVEDGALADGGLQPDPATVVLDDLLADR